MTYKKLENITIKKESVFYHGTDSKGLQGILIDKKIGTPYFDEVGFFLSKDFEDSHNHGQYVLVFSKIDLTKIQTDDVNDGFFHKGFLSIDFIDYIIVSGNDRRIANDLINSLLESYKISD
jgi:hypothetical protein